MTTDDRDVIALAARVRIALESPDLSLFGELLDPNVSWGGPDDPNPSCQSRDDVLAWYGRARATGRRAHVVDVHAHDNKILVHLRVTTPSTSLAPIPTNDRWQILTCTRGRIIDIRGYETETEARARYAPKQP